MLSAASTQWYPTPAATSRYACSCCRAPCGRHQLHCWPQLPALQLLKLSSLPAPLVHTDGLHISAHHSLWDCVCIHLCTTHTCHAWPPAHLQRRRRQTHSHTHPHPQANTSFTQEQGTWGTCLPSGGTEPPPYSGEGTPVAAAGRQAVPRIPLVPGHPPHLTEEGTVIKNAAKWAYPAHMNGCHADAGITDGTCRGCAVLAPWQVRTAAGTPCTEVAQTRIRTHPEEQCCWDQPQIQHLMPHSSTAACVNTYFNKQAAAPPGQPHGSGLSMAGTPEPADAAASQPLLALMWPHTGRCSGYAHLMIHASKWKPHAGLQHTTQEPAASPRRKGEGARKGTHVMGHRLAPLPTGAGAHQ
jgi:hypothetical protein